MRCGYLDKSLKDIGKYELCFETASNDKISLVYDNDGNIYTITDAFTKQIEEKNKLNQIKKADPISLQPAYMRFAALLNRTFHHSCVIQ